MKAKKTIAIADLTALYQGLKSSGKLDSKDKHLQRLKNSLEVNAEQVKVFCLIFMGQVNDGESQGINELANLIGLEKMDGLKFLEPLENLEEKGLLESNESRKGIPRIKGRIDRTYWISQSLMDEILNNQIDTSLKMKDEFEMLQYLFELGLMVKENKMNVSAYFNTAKELLSNNSQFSITQELEKLDLDISEKLIILLSLIRYIEKRPISTDLLAAMTCKGITQRLRLKVPLINGKAKLIKEDYLCMRRDEMNMEMCLFPSNKGLELLKHISDSELLIDTPKPEHELLTTINPEGITAIKLAYDAPIDKEYKRLQEILDEDNLKKIYGRLKGKGLSCGLNILLSGSPGTGKTEMVKQLAKQHGRTILSVNMSDIKGAFVGQSERNVKNIFTQYTEALKHERTEPILLLNEADALIGKPASDNRDRTGVTNMLNTMQNILLQELEDFEGILVATTNLPNAFDEAFNRRFLIQLNIEKPSFEARQSIWKMHFPALSSNEISELATHHLTGADIENLAVRMTHLEILEDQKPSARALGDLIGFSPKNSTPVGFKTIAA